MRPLSVQRVRRALRKPPSVLARRIAAELYGESERIRAPLVDRRFGTRQLLHATRAGSVEELWQRLLNRVPFPPLETAFGVDPGRHEHEIIAAAGRALRREVDLLGSGPQALGDPIDWHSDFKSGRRWPPQFFRSIEYGARDSGADVKVPWELSRVQWLIPAGQAYALTGEERYAIAVKDILADWIAGNPFAASVNWAVTMEVALRVVSWTWLVGALGRSKSWMDITFQASFLRSLYLHGAFAERHLELSDVNGNHCTADAAGLAIAGMVFGDGNAPRRWAERGWAILCEELPRQVYDDGVDFEASTAYHRLVAELFLLPALHRERLGLEVPEWYRERVRAMARFTAAYSRPDGSAPWWGDADDGRALPLAAATADDHTHLVEIVRTAWGGVRGGVASPAALTETLWLLGRLPEPEPPTTHEPTAFPSGGVYILRDDRDHIFIDCGPVGLAGRGGHGHNDCLAFDAYVDDTHVLADPGSYVYTESWEWRNEFRRTAAHNTPQIDAAEQNRFVSDSLWLLRDDAKPEVREWQPHGAVPRFVGSHSGYRRLPSPVRPIRTIELDTRAHRLVVRDEFEGNGDHDVEISVQLAAAIAVERMPRHVVLRSDRRCFILRWTSSADWTLDLENGWVSPSYGVKVAAPRLKWSRSGSLAAFSFSIEPWAPDRD